MNQTVLVIEDQEDNRRILRDLLISAGFKIVEAVDGSKNRTADDEFLAPVGGVNRNVSVEGRAPTSRRSPRSSKMTSAAYGRIGSGFGVVAVSVGRRGYSIRGGSPVSVSRNAVIASISSSDNVSPNWLLPITATACLRSHTLPE